MVSATRTDPRFVTASVDGKPWRRSALLVEVGWQIDDVAPPLERQAGAIVPYFSDGQFSCWPYWWLMSDDCFRSMLRLMGLAIREEWKWDDHCLFALCERT